MTVIYTRIKSDSATNTTNTLSHVLAHKDPGGHPLGHLNDWTTLHQRHVRIPQTNQKQKKSNLCFLDIQINFFSFFFFGRNFSWILSKKQRPSKNFEKWFPNYQKVKVKTNDPVCSLSRLGFKSFWND